MQLTGDRFTSVSAAFGNDLSTLPDYPAEIRAPAGTVHGVSSFQVHISDHDITTPGDTCNVLVAMNPAALKADLRRLEANGLLIVNSDTFDERNLEKAGLRRQPADRRQPQPLPRRAGADDQAHQGRHRAARRQAAATPTARRTSSPSGWCRGCTRARPSRRSTGSTSRFAGNDLVQAVEPDRVPDRLPLRRDGRAVRPPLRDRRRPGCRRASTPRSAATPPSPGA